MKRILAILAIAAATESCSAQYRLIPGQADEDGCFPKTPARICLSDQESGCYVAPTEREYVFGLEPKAVPIGQLNGEPLVLFSAMFSGCGSGTLTHYSLLAVRGKNLLNLLPKVELSNQSEYKIWTLPAISHAPVMATADFIWDDKETHFAPHRYRIDVYVFDPEGRAYLRKLSYNSGRKYPGLDEVDEIKVLEAEKPAILSRLAEGDR